MLELIMMAMLCFVMWKVADMSNRRPAIWMPATIGACLVSFLIPLPFLRVGIVAVGMVVAMMFVKK